MSTKDSSNASSPQAVKSEDKLTPPINEEGNTSGSEKVPADPSGSDVDRSSQSKSAGEQGQWTAAWDENAQAYYWWNMVTYETTWENPYEKTETTNREREASGSQSPAAYPAYPTQDYSYTFQAYFNSRTGKFQAANDVDRLNPERMSIENRATRQMQYYFDVDAYTEQRNRDRSLGLSKASKQRLTKKEIDRYKKAKMEKKMKRAREWLCD
ncbi:hypothetical protein BJV82DRAFT_514131 [Fennellomyces sp. T-0311]|nr:hypothetical protein BJV82DRAFT_514131 [Fennellomyces sp. T-0311]